MDPRLNLLGNNVMAKNLKSLVQAATIPNSILPTATQELCKLRAS
jgi:hypothetical protein